MKLSKRKLIILFIGLFVLIAGQVIFVQAEEEELVCADSDNGSYYIKGETFGRGSGNLSDKWYTREDACYKDTNPEYIEYVNRLKENSCLANDELNTITYECPFGCANGACVCPGPYMVVDTEGKCVWDCNEGSKPDVASITCVCEDGYAEAGTDSKGRTVCAVSEEALPDLSIDKIMYSPEKPEIDEIVSISVYLKNSGIVTLTDATGISNYAYDFDNFVLDSNYEIKINQAPTPHNPLEPGEFTVYVFSGYFNKVATNTLSFTADQGDKLEESDEDNNKYSASLVSIEPTGANGCYDTDKGQDYFTKGKIMLPDGFQFSDFCRNELELAEVYCIDEINWRMFTYNCRIGCEDGACVSVDDLGCESFTYSNCPDACERACVPSQCNGDICASDCDGEGSCLTPAIGDFDMSSQAQLLLDDNLTSILNKLDLVRDSAKEQLYKVKYFDELSESLAASPTTEQAIINFITYGVDENTKFLGAGERAAVVFSYLQAYGKLPETRENFIDVIKAANGRWPGETSRAAEAGANGHFKKIYKKIPDMDNPKDRAAIVVMAYGLRQTAGNRNLNSERAGINTFKAIYGYHPASTADWNIMQAITYSGAAREPDSDGDYLVDAREAAFGTDPNNPDSDGDGFLDGDEVLNGYDPLK